MIQKFEEFINEDEMASVDNTPGMGNIEFPEGDEEGSGDIHDIGANKENRSFKKKTILSDLQSVTEGLYNNVALENEYEFFIDKKRAENYITSKFSIFDILANTKLHKININDLKNIFNSNQIKNIDKALDTEVLFQNK